MIAASCDLECMEGIKLVIYQFFNEGEVVDVLLV